jgi:16S rRNA (cytosine967-C5)-methyltransferase
VTQIDIPELSDAELTANGLPARRAALSLVDAALARRGGFEEAMNTPPFSQLTGSDRAFARNLASTTLRGLGRIDHLLNARLKSPPPPAALALLRLGAAQILFGLAPAFAAVSTTVDLADQYPSTQRFKGLINAILRGLDRDGGARLAQDLPATLNAPDWLVARWRAAFGEAQAAALCARIAETPPTDVTPKRPELAAAVAAALGGVVLATGSVRVTRRGDVAEWPGYEDGTWWVQDASATLPARLLAVSAGETALDMCAAPGGKTLQLAAAGALVTAVDRSARRLQRVEENLNRTQLEAERVTADVSKFSDDGRTFDAVLLDAPCSATGTFRRHPDVLWGARPADIAKLADVQSRLLDAAARLTSPGGRLVYSVCSLEPEEGEAQAEAFLRRHPGFQRGQATPDSLGLSPETQGRPGEFRLLPGSLTPEGGQDGFFAVLFVRIA